MGNTGSDRHYGTAQILRDVGVGVTGIVLLAGLLWWLLGGSDDSATPQPHPGQKKSTLAVPHNASEPASGPPTETAVPAAPAPAPENKISEAGQTNEANPEIAVTLEPTPVSDAETETDTSATRTPEQEALTIVRVERIHKALANGDWFADSPDAALRLIRKLDQTDPSHTQDLRQELQSNVGFRIQSLLDEGHDVAALEFAATAQAADPEYSGVAAEQALARNRVQIANAVSGLIRHKQPDDAAVLIKRLRGLGAEKKVTDRLAAALVGLRKLLAGPKARTLRDPLIGGGHGPVMAIIRAGTFRMGSPQTESGRWPEETPPQEIHFAHPFAIGLTEISVGEFALFVNATGYVSDAEKNGFSRTYYESNGLIQERTQITWRKNYLGDKAVPNEPVVHVSWNDAQDYVKWLSDSTGRAYRLPSEAEFEYAERGGTSTPYWWGTGTPKRALENLAGQGDRSPHGNRGWGTAFEGYTDQYFGPAPVKALRANPFGLYDMTGNVSEWVADCWQDSLLGTASDGSARGGTCKKRVFRGGSWAAPPNRDRSAFRSRRSADFTSAEIGFRVARDLN